MSWKSVGKPPKKPWASPDSGPSQTCLKLRGAPFVYPAYDLTTHLPYDRRRRQHLDTSRDQSLLSWPVALLDLVPPT